MPIKNQIACRLEEHGFESLPMVPAVSGTSDLPDRLDIEVLIADGPAMVRSGLQRIIDGEPGLHVSGEAVDGPSALAWLQTERCDVLLLDIDRPAPSGPTLIGQIRTQWPLLPILVVSMHHEAATVRAALEAGANGYITKDSEPQGLLEALHRVAGGGRFVEPRLLYAMVFASPVLARQALSQRECQVMQRLVAGQANKAIARALHLSEKTISTHKTNLMLKLDVKTLADLVRHAENQL